LYKNTKLIALFSTILWLVFTFAAFKGFHFWYAGFIFFFWLSLASLNYRHETTLWHLKNRTSRFLQFFFVLFTIGFITDFIIGQRISHLWSYPLYSSFGDWTRLYLIIYPFGGLSVLELIFFLSNTFGEKFIFTHRTENLPEKIIDASDHFVDLFLLLVVMGLPILYFFNIPLPFRHLILYGFLIWALVATVKFAYHIRHGLHWVAILLASLFMSVFLHEIPNTAVFEWRYYNAPILNSLILDIPLWVFLGWYIIVLMMLRIWVRFVWAKKTN